MHGPRWLPYNFICPCAPWSLRLVLRGSVSEPRAIPRNHIQPAAKRSPQPRARVQKAPMPPAPGPPRAHATRDVQVHASPLHHTHAPQTSLPSSPPRARTRIPTVCIARGRSLNRLQLQQHCSGPRLPPRRDQSIHIRPTRHTTPCRKPTRGRRPSAPPCSGSGLCSYRSTIPTLVRAQALGPTRR